MRPSAHRGTAMSTVVLVGTALIAGLLVTAPAARAEGPVSITATGPATVRATVGRATATSWADFDITDTSRTATHIFVCFTPPNGKGRECDSTPLTSSTYSDGNPQVQGADGSYRYRARISYSDITKEQCWTAHFSQQPYRILVSVRNAADVELASATHPYRVDCTGLVPTSSGPKRLVVYSGRSSSKAVLKFYLLDTLHRATSIRLCNYDEVNDRYYGCARERMSKSWRTDFGWMFSYTRSWGAMGASSCALIKRRWPDVGTRVEYYDDSMHKLETSYQGFHLECG